jgi:hypothetical protein
MPVIPTSLEDEINDFQFGWSSDAGSLVIRINDLNKYTSLHIFDVTGKQMISQKITQNTVEVSTIAMPPGIYLAAVRGINGRRNFKILKQ